MIVLLMNLFLAFLTYFSAELFPRPHHKRRAISFAAGTAMSYLFIQLYPEVMSGIPIVGNAVFVAVLVGFSSYYMCEQFLHEYYSGRKLMLHRHDAHVVFFTAYHFIIGMIIWMLYQQSVARGAVFTVSIAFFLFITTRALNSLHMTSKKEKKIKELILAFAFPLGGITASFLHLSNLVFFLMFAFLGGALTYILVREMIPSESNGNATFFFIGATLNTIVLLLFNVFVPGLFA